LAAGVVPVGDEGLIFRCPWHVPDPSLKVALAFSKEKYSGIALYVKNNWDLGIPGPDRTPICYTPELVLQLYTDRISESGSGIGVGPTPAPIPKKDWNFLCGRGINKKIELRGRIRCEDPNVNPAIG
jgi:hypothetical protein